MECYQGVDGFLDELLSPGDNSDESFVDVCSRFATDSAEYGQYVVVETAQPWVQEVLTHVAALPDVEDCDAVAGAIVTPVGDSFDGFNLGQAVCTAPALHLQIMLSDIQKSRKVDSAGPGAACSDCEGRTLNSPTIRVDDKLGLQCFTGHTTIEAIGLHAGRPRDADINCEL